MTLPPPSLVIRSIVSAFPSIRPHLSPATLKAAGGYDGIRYLMSAAVFDAVEGYLSGGGNVTTYKAQMAAAVAQAYVEAADAGYEEGGGELPLDADTAAWARAQLDAQLAFVDSMFETLRELRKEEDVDANGEAERRADGWASGLDGFYNESILRGSKNVMAYWVLGSTEKHCPSCSSLAGGGHKISWYIDRDYIPRKNGCALDCKGYNCDCRLEDKNGNEITI
jgi:hypothetical protein